MTLECQVEDCDNVAAYVTVKAEYFCHKHKPSEEVDLTDDELDRRHENSQDYKPGWGKDY